jgi:hypothetical protein
MQDLSADPNHAMLILARLANAWAPLSSEAEDTAFPT